MLAVYKNSRNLNQCNTENKQKNRYQELHPRRFKQFGIIKLKTDYEHETIFFVICLCFSNLYSHPKAFEMPIDVVFGY